MSRDVLFSEFPNRQYAISVRRLQELNSPSKIEEDLLHGARLGHLSCRVRADGDAETAEGCVVSWAEELQLP
jgi:hypothetical protein